MKASSRKVLPFALPDAAVFACGALAAVGLAFTSMALPAQSDAAAAEQRPFAIRNARVVTIAGPVIENGTVLVRDGKIEAVGKAAEVAVAPGYDVVDAAGGTLLPGLVSAHGQAGLERAPRPTMPQVQGGGRRGRRGGGMMPQAGPAPVNRAAAKVADSVYARQDVFGELLAQGVTTLAVTPPGSGIPGLAAVLDPAGKTAEQLVVDDDAYVTITPSADTRSKDLLRDAFAKAKQVVEQRHRPAAPAGGDAATAGRQPGGRRGMRGDEAAGGSRPARPGEQPKPEEPDDPKPEPKPDEPKPQPKPEPKPDDPKPQPKPDEPKPEPKPDEPKPEPKPNEPKPDQSGRQQPGAGAQDGRERRGGQGQRGPQKDPNLEILADLLEGKRTAFVQLDSANDLMHWRTVAKDVSFPMVVVAPRPTGNEGHLEDALDTLKALKAPVLIPPRLTTQPNTNVLQNPALTLHEHGLEIGFLVGDSRNEVRSLFAHLIELHRCGAPADVLLRAVTLVPAKMLRLQDRVGSIAKDKDASLLLFDGDPLQPTSKLVRIWHRGQPVGEVAN